MKNEDKDIQTDLNEHEEVEVEPKECQEDEVSIESLKEEIASLKDENLREAADFENIKKRLEKEKYQAINYAHEQFARDLLPIIDALENAILRVSNEEATSKDAIKNYKEGIELTIEQFRKCFEKHGIKAISTQGEFDPNIHEAIMKVDSDEVDSGQIVQCIQKGYIIKDRVLRPSMVSIAK